MALPKNRRAVRAILREIEPRIIGQERSGWQCGCGAIKCGDAIAIAVEPAGDSHPGQEALWYVWSVLMAEKGREPDELGYDWSCGLSDFIPAEELREIFARYFGEESREEEYPYRLDIDGEERFHQGLPAAVRILENDRQIRFCFDWGVSQEVAIQLDNIQRAVRGDIRSGSSAFDKVVGSLRTLQPEIEVYRGGPSPSLVTRVSRIVGTFIPSLKPRRSVSESEWLMNYSRALTKAAQVADHIFFQNSGSHHDWRGSVRTEGDIVFSKVTA